MTEFQKYFTIKSKGGYSNCINRGGGSTIPNCVGWGWGCFFFYHGRKDFNIRPQGDAKDIYEKCKKDGSGFIVAKIVKENALACYACGEHGHVVYIHFKLPDGNYLCSESNSSGTVKNGRYIRFMLTPNPAVLYKNYQGCVYAFT